MNLFFVILILSLLLTNVFATTNTWDNMMTMMSASGMDPKSIFQKIKDKISMLFNKGGGGGGGGQPKFEILQGEIIEVDSQHAQTTQAPITWVMQSPAPSPAPSTQKW